MKSPFPGMDPYIEDRNLWPNFQLDLMSEIGIALALVLPDSYYVKCRRREYVELEGIGSGAPPEREPEAGVFTMRAFLDEHYREPFLEIYNLDDEKRLVTRIEFLS